MQTTTALVLLTVAVVHAAAASSNTSYNAVSLETENQTVGVIVDCQIYPLSSVDDSSELLHTGTAPIASNGYQYALFDKSNTSNVIDREVFLRDSITKSSKTLNNEYYGRSWNAKHLDKLPTIIDPLLIIHRIQSDLYIDGQIPTIHIIGNQTAIDYIHTNSQSNINNSNLKMAYIRLTLC